MDRNSQILAKYSHEIASLERAILDPAFKTKINPLFYLYCGGFVTTEEGIRNYFLQNAVIGNYCHIEDKAVLDLGCGIGFRAVCLALLGAKKVIAVDISENMLECLEVLLEGLPQLNVEVDKGDFLVLDYQPCSQDVIIVADALSHICDTELALDRIGNIIRSGGFLYILDGNNDMFLNSRLRRRKTWKTAEYVPSSGDWAVHGREFDKLCYFDARIKIIQEHFPSLDGALLRKISDKTQGLYGEQIISATEEFLDKGTISIKATFPFRNPYTGEFPELGINPYSLIKDLKKRGFQAKPVPPPMIHVGIPLGLPGWKSAVVQAILPVLRKSPQFLLPLLYPSFSILAEKSLTTAE